MKALILLLPIALFIVGCGGGDPNADQHEAAYEAAKEGVRSMLKSPSTAEFAPLPTEFKKVKNNRDANVYYEGGEVDFDIDSTGLTRRVFGWVDAQNPMGAMLRSDFIVSVFHDKEEGKWLVTDAKIIDDDE